MIELIATSDPVRLSCLRAALEAAGIPSFVFDSQIPLPGAVPCRLMVAADDAELARYVLEQAEPG